VLKYCCCSSINQSFISERRYLLSPVCRLSVCNARASYSAGRNFRQYFYAIWCFGYPLTSTENFTEIVPPWRVRGKTIRSVLCNSCAQCNAHTYEQTNSSLDWVLSHWTHFTVLDSFLYCVLLCFVCMRRFVTR